MLAPVVTICPLRPDLIPDAKRLLTEYFQWALSLDEGAESAPTFEGIKEELETLPGKYAPPGGQFFIASLDGKAVGCVAFRPMSSATAELKRLYVSQEGRGHQLGRLLVARLVEEARAAGYQRIYLDSHHTMKHAHEVYRAEGFSEIPAPEGFPEQFRPIVVFMERKLGPGDDEVRG